MRLSALYPKLSPDECRALAEKAGTHPGYLWQLATRWKGKKASLDMMQRLAAADRRLKLSDLVAEFTEPAHG